LVLHQDGNVTGRAAEDQANQFASAFLMPRADILAQIQDVYSLDHIIRAKALARFGRGPELSAPQVRRHNGLALSRPVHSAFPESLQRKRALPN
jgi:hypothetical protein